MNDKEKAIFYLLPSGKDLLRIILKQNITNIQNFTINLIKKIEIIINLKNKLIQDYFKLDYDSIMTELDSLLWTDRCLKKCKDKGMGFCFCKNYRGDYVS